MFKTIILTLSRMFEAVQIMVFHTSEALRIAYIVPPTISSRMSTMHLRHYLLHLSRLW